MKISELKVNQKAIILKYKNICPNSYKSKLLSLGLTPGTILELKRVSIDKKTIIISVRNTQLIVRENEISAIEVKKI